MAVSATGPGAPRDRSQAVAGLSFRHADEPQCVAVIRVEIEDVDVLKRRIADAARYHPLERLALAPQCGFASGAETAEERKITEQTQRDKLRLIVDVARAVWPSQ